MPAVSKAQQKLMGQAWAVRKGELAEKDADPEAVKIAKSDMTDKELKSFAETKHKGLPEKIKEALLSESNINPRDIAQYVESFVKSGPYDRRVGSYADAVKHILTSIIDALEEELSYNDADKEQLDSMRNIIDVCKRAFKDC